MKKLLVILFWCAYVITVSVPLLFVLASKFDWNVVQSKAPFLVLVWVAASLVFLGFAIFMGIKMKRTKAEEEHLNKNFQETALILCLAFIGSSLWLIKRRIPPEILWNIVIVFWVVFTFCISRTLLRFARRYQQERI